MKCVIKSMFVLYNIESIIYKLHMPYYVVVNKSWNIDVLINIIIVHGINVTIQIGEKIRYLTSV